MAEVSQVHAAPFPIAVAVVLTALVVDDEMALVDFS
jgi:multisubunit Na+/H+ antiporter MnhC subunit